MNSEKKVKAPAITPELLAYLRGEVGCIDELMPAMKLLRDDYEAGKAGVDEDKYPRDEDIEYIERYDGNGNLVEDADGVNEYTIRRILALERLCWEQGRMDAEMGVAV